VDRFFHSETFQTNSTLLFEAEEVHHMKVLRIKEGETIEIVNGKNELAFGTVIFLKRSKAEVKIEKVRKKEPSKKKWVLAVGISPMQRMEMIVEKTTELGVDEIYIFQTERSQKGTFSPSNQRRLEKIAISAMKQCKRWDLPKITYSSSIDEVANLCDAQYFGDLSPNAPSTASISDVSSIALFIGPEKGFLEKEIAHLHKVASGVSLSWNVLRVDTACISALSHVSSRVLPFPDKQDRDRDPE